MATRCITQCLQFFPDPCILQIINSNWIKHQVFRSFALTGTQATSASWPHLNCDTLDYKIVCLSLLRWKLIFQQLPLWSWKWRKCFLFPFQLRGWWSALKIYPAMQCFLHGARFGILFWGRHSTSWSRRIWYAHALCYGDRRSWDETIFALPGIWKGQ